MIVCDFVVEGGDDVATDNLSLLDVGEMAEDQQLRPVAAEVDLLSRSIFAIPLL